ncbi:hypothetical protein PIB30_071419 [Stylosanthes scabra]|uniref:Uncharacterized protein n=1 Tax=Stylosanthes scabra TaxID=79078 RepID=A0ABU6QNC8_9FABA|nr:hypothetical protein [Stylosanthes scabra]
METKNNTYNANIQDINSDNQLYHNKAIPSNILDDLVGCMKLFILQVAILNNEDHQTVPNERSEEHVPSDKGEKVIKDNAPLEEDTDIFLGRSDPEDIGTLVNARKSGAINIIDLDEEIIAQLEIGCVFPVELKSKFPPTTEMQLTLQDCQISLYVFGYDLSEGETLFKNEKIEMTRADFQCLIPNNEVHSNILMFAALKTTIAHRASDETLEEISDKITTWSLPPQFGLELLDYILCGLYSATKGLENKDLLDNWPFNKARGIPDCKTSDDSTVRLLKWMAMEDMFQPNLTTRLGGKH